ncbi:MAG: zinc ABC transporter substrate-binding protein [Deltaproteobacteria bacterium]|nr:zinc ABC transporter substrate-binding protein [Deltaproteobacteria bacterium]
MRKIFLMFLSVVVAFSLFLQSCQKNEKKTDDRKNIKVVTTLFPLYDFAKNIGQQKAAVSLLVPPGVEPHNFEPRPNDITRIQDSDLLIFTGKYMEPWVDNLLKGLDTKRLTVVDTSKDITLIRRTDSHDEAEHTHQEESGSPDPHIWLDFSNAVKMVDAITTEFIAKDPQNKDFYAKNSHEYKKKLEELDKKYKDTLLRCRDKVIIHAGHFAFGYLAKRYDLMYASAYKGFAPNAEPTPKRLVELTNNVKKHGVRYIYYEELITPKIAEVISKETGCSLLMLHGAHNVTRKEMDSGVTFVQLMEINLENLKVGLQCP